MSSTGERVAIVTGASQGIGYAIARKLVQEGRKVAFVSLGLDAVKPEFERELREGRVSFHEMDVSDNEAIARCAQDVAGSWGRIDILINNAGIRTETAIEDIGPEEWNRIMAVNLGSTFFFSQAVVPVMKKRQWGRIVNMSSFGGQFGPLTSSAAYCASKAGQLALTKVFARTLAADGITVNAVAPAAIRTPEMDKIPADMLAGMVRTIPVGRVGEAEEVAELVSYLVSDHGGFVTGATMDINGGRLMR